MDAYLDRNAILRFESTMLMIMLAKEGKYILTRVRKFVVYRVPSVFSILLLLLRDSANYKIRIHSAAALAVPAAREGMFLMPMHIKVEVCD